MMRPVVVGLVLLLASQTASAQSVDSIPLSRVRVGSELRVWTQDLALDGRRFVLTGSSVDAINVAAVRRSGGLMEPTPIPLADVQRIETFQGRRASGPYFLKSALLGAAVGTFIGAAMGACLDEGIGRTDDPRPFGLFLFGTLGFGTGTFVGAKAGAGGAAVWAPVKLNSR